LRRPESRTAPSPALCVAAGARYVRAVLTLTPLAAGALEIARRDGRDLRYVVVEHCHTGRHRLSVRYVVPDPQGGAPRDVNLGLLWSEDLAALEALRDELERGGGGAAPAGGR
jgi:hypothetical protein